MSAGWRATRWSRTAVATAAWWAVGAAGCAPTPVVRATTQQLYARAAFELSCHPSMLRVASLGDGVRGVSGCGQHLVYVERCELLDGVRRCMWVLNSVGSVLRGGGAPGTGVLPARPWVSSPVLPPVGTSEPAASARPTEVLDDRK